MKTRIYSILCAFVLSFVFQQAYAQPTASAPTPTHSSSDVISVFSNHYTAATKGFKPLAWTASVASIETIAGTNDDIVKIPSLGDCPVDINTWKIKEKKYIHMDVYWASGNGTFYFGFANNFGANPTVYTSSEYKWPTLKQNEWVGIDIPVEEFSKAGLGLDGIMTMRFRGSGTFYIDNFYAYGKDEPEPFDVTPAPTPTHSASDVVSVFSNHYTAATKFTPQNWPPAKVAEIITISGTDDQVLKVAKLGDSPLFVNTWNISGKGYIHMDVLYEGDSSEGFLTFGLSNAWGANPIYFPTKFTWPSVVAGKWVSFDIPIKEFESVGLSLSDIISMRLKGSGTFYIDNFYAYGKPDTSVEEDITILPAPLPMQLPEYATSVFSDRYTSSATLDVDGASVKTLNIKGENDAVLEIKKGTTIDISSWDISSRKFVHLDVYLVEGSDNSFSFELGNNNTTTFSPKDYAWATTEKGKWASYDIPVEAFVSAGLALNSIKSIKIKANSTFYIDNFYAYSTPDDSGDFKVRTQFGVNLAGGEFGGSALYPTKEEDWTYYQKKGLGLIRVPFKWERLQPTLNGELSQNDLTILKQIAEIANKKGMQLMLDMHNYGRRKVDGYTDSQIIDGVPELTRNDFANTWKKIAQEFKDHNLWGYDLMNEPHDMGTSSWKDIAQAAIYAIREVDTKTPIIIEGNGWASADRWPTSSDMLKDLIDPSNRLIYQAHCYFDRDASGVYAGTYDSEVVDNQVAIKRLANFVNWLKLNNKIGMIGELGSPGDDARWLTMLDDACAYLKDNNVSLTYWAAGRHWSSGYKLDIHPANNDFTKDRPQMTVLEKYGDFYSSIEDNAIDSKTNSVTIYPNPVKDAMNIKSEASINKINIYNLTGQLVFTEVFDNVTEITVDVNNLSKGYYLVRIQANDNTSVTQKIIKQ